MNRPARPGSGLGVSDRLLAGAVLALAWRTGIKLFDIKCAWFNEETYCEFFPRTLMPKRWGAPLDSRR